MYSTVSVENVIKHYGVKGMKWGVRRYQPYQPGDGQKAKGKFKGTRRARETTASIKREREASKLGRNDRLKTLSDDQLRSITSRLRNENDLKRLSTASKDKGDQSDYRLRATMSDEELQSRVQRLQLEDNLRQQAVRATQQHTDLANAVIKGAANSAVKDYNRDIDPSVLSAVSGALDEARPKSKNEKEIQKMVNEVNSARSRHIARDAKKYRDELNK